MTKREWLRPEEVADRLKVTTMTLRRWAESGRIQTMTLPSGHRRYLEADVERIETQTKDSPP
jgi:excisionase family DNA binding protein